MSYPPENVPSPCVKVCVLDRATGLCRGCLRSIDEIADWVEMTADQKRATLARIDERRAGRAGRPGEDPD
jgi:predicted Fe-S protein YdhL (DUF1289 family)